MCRLGWGFFFFFALGGEISPNFDLKNMSSTYTKDFSWGEKKELNSPDFEGKNKSHISRFFIISSSRLPRM